MGNFAENLNLGNRFRPPLTPTGEKFSALIVLLRSLFRLKRYASIAYYTLLCDTQANPTPFRNPVGIQHGRVPAKR